MKTRLKIVDVKGNGISGEVFECETFLNNCSYIVRRTGTFFKP